MSIEFLVSLSVDHYLSRSSFDVCSSALSGHNLLQSTLVFRFRSLLAPFTRCLQFDFDLLHSCELSGSSLTSIGEHEEFEVVDSHVAEIRIRFDVVEKRVEVFLSVGFGEVVPPVLTSEAGENEDLFGMGIVEMGV